MTEKMAGEDEAEQAAQDALTLEGVDKEPQQPQYMTADQFKQVMQQQTEAFARQISGLQAKWDRGLNAIRSDTMGWVQNQVAEWQTKAGREGFLAGLDEDQRKMAQGILAELDRRNPEQPKQPVREPVGEADQDQWQQVRSIVESMGVSPDEPGVDYGALSNQTLTQKQRQDKFLGSITAIIKGQKQQAIADKPTQQKAPQPAPSPQPNATPRGTAGYRNADEVRDAYITDKISLTEYRQRMQALGEPV